MPRPRFDRLPAERRTALLEAAAQEFATHGYEAASLNRILELAGVSKGAAYYYFDDKEDLFLTVVRYYMAALNLDKFFAGLPETATPETYWSSLREVYQRAFVRSHDLPWAFGIWRAASEQWRTRPDGAFAAYAGEWFDLAMRLFKRGQALGVVRTDLPDDLLMAWARAVDDAHDRWVMAHWDELDADGLSAAAERMVDGLRRLIGSDRGAP